MTYDRNYFRMLSDSDLIARARQSDSELAVVLGERLAELADLEQAHDRFIVELENKRDEEAKEMTQEIAALKATLAALMLPDDDDDDDDDDLTVFADPEDAFKDAPLSKRGAYGDAEYD